MIHVDRSTIYEPDWWNSTLFQSFLQRWFAFHRAGSTRAAQTRLSALGSRDRLETWTRLALPLLLEGFHGKCAYTEEPIDEETGTVVFHRPLSDAIGLESDVSPEHYWWLLADWSNWYPASQRVASVKGTSFPVVGPRLDPPPQNFDPFVDPLGPVLDFGVLLDPAQDYAAWYLEFCEDGSVRSREHPNPETRRKQGGQPRGELTIKTLGLNLDPLQESRRASINRNRPHADNQFPVDPRDFSAFAAPASTAPFAGAEREVLARTLLRYLANLKPRLGCPWEEFRMMIYRLAEEMAAEIACNGVPWTSSPIPPDLWNPLRSIFHREWPDLDDAGFLALVGGDREMREIVERQREENVQTIADSGIEKDESPLSAPIFSHLESRRIVERTERVERIEIENFKAIERLDLDLSSEPVLLPTPFDPREPSAGEEVQATRWTALLGENGSGKSCCLQAIGLALAADRLGDLLDQLEYFDWGKVLRRGTAEGRIVLRFTGDSVLDLGFDAGGHWWNGPDAERDVEPPRMAAYVRGYGATRLLDGGPVEGTSEHVRLANLFDPHANVLDAQEWLLGLDEGDFNVAALTLGGFLEDDRDRPLTPPDPDGPKLMSRKDGEVLVGGDPLHYLSDGYRAVITLVCDILAGLGVGWSDLRHATGIVLIDELGAHLHPRWKMEITGRLRRELPNVQFFVSTHEPLCLRGLFEKEVIRVRKPKRRRGEPEPPGGVTLEVIDRSPSDYRVDQLLTSEFFGLDTTIDPDLDRRFQAYYRLLAMEPEDRAKKGLDALLTDLRAYIQTHGQPALGFTRRDQLVYEAIDQFLSREQEMTPEERHAEREATLGRIQDIWKARGAVSGPGGAGSGRR